MKSYTRDIVCQHTGCGQFGVVVEQDAHVSYLPRKDSGPGSVEVYRYDDLLCGDCDKPMKAL